MIYPKEFVEKVRAEFVDAPDVSDAAEEGRYCLGILLARSATMRFSPEDIVDHVDAGDLASVREDAARAVRRRYLHAEWMRIVLKSLAPPPEAPRAPSASSSRRSLRPSYSLGLASQ